MRWNYCTTIPSSHGTQFTVSLKQVSMLTWDIHDSDISLFIPGRHTHTHTNTITTRRQKTHIKHNIYLNAISRPKGDNTASCNVISRQYSEGWKANRLMLYECARIMYYVPYKCCLPQEFQLKWKCVQWCLDNSACKLSSELCDSRGSKQKNCAHFEESMKLCMDKL